VLISYLFALLFAVIIFFNGKGFSNTFLLKRKSLRMKLIWSLSLLHGCLQLNIAAKSPDMDELVSTFYQKESEKVASFFLTAGTPVVDYAHPTLRTEAEAVLHDRATAHFEYYKDAACTQIDHFLDLKINSCSNLHGPLVVSLLTEIGSHWMLALQPMDGDCSNPKGEPTINSYEKNVCTLVDGGYVKFNLIGHRNPSP
jgi:hypothetical protein